VPVVASFLFAASAAVVLLLGVLHMLYTYRGEKLFPRDAALVQRMQEVSPVISISRQTTMWRAGIGFHASHSMGAILFGMLYLFFAFEPSHFLFTSRFLLCLGFVYLAVMVVLARLYWFSIPFEASQ
jgi:hypothetical protein